MKRIVQLGIVMLSVTMMVVDARAQWRCYYATWDEETNGIGHNTPSVGVIRNNMFVALVMTLNSSGQNVRNFMVPYVDADSSKGRKNYFGYGGATLGIFQVWSDGGFDQVTLQRASHLAATPDSFIYVANNDPEHNILIFKYVNDTIAVVSPFQRQVTGSTGIFGIEVSQNGYVYVCTDTSNGVTNDIQVFNPISQWSSSHLDPPVTTINLPDGIYKDVAVSPNGQQLFIADYGGRRILKYVGSPTTGYTQDTNFNFALSPGDTIIPVTTGRPSVIGLAYLSPNNILFAAVHVWVPFTTFSEAYPYGRIYLINPNTGALVSSDTSLSVIDVAAWNYTLLDSSYTSRVGGTVPGNASGYTSTYDVDFDENGNLYTQSHYGWTVDKWRYQGTLPTITSVEEISAAVPESFRLGQNYPNPFNPTTTIEFSLLRVGHVRLTVHNLLGQEVATLVDGEKAVGTYRVTFDPRLNDAVGQARDLPSGTYFYRLRSGGYSEVRKMMLLR